MILCLLDIVLIVSKPELRQFVHILNRGVATHIIWLCLCPVAIESRTDRTYAPSVTEGEGACEILVKTHTHEERDAVGIANGCVCIP